ncbi:hypothetical protein BH24BAC1_BH24BAC1_16370 [soil metagenome]
MIRIKILLFFLVLAGLSPTAVAQKYRTAAGVRIGKSDYGLTVQQKLFERTTIEGLAGFGEREARATVLLEQHFPIIGKPFNYYLGAGAHMGTLKEYGGFYGVDAIAGVEMKLPLFPLVASVDIKPAFHVNHENWVSLQGGFSVRYILVKEKRQERRIMGIFGKKEEPKKSAWPFGKKVEPAPKKPGLFGKKPAPEPVKKKRGLFGLKKEPEPVPEPPKKRFRLFDREPEPAPLPPPPPEKKRFRLFEKEPEPQPQPAPEPEKRRIRW